MARQKQPEPEQEEVTEQPEQQDNTLPDPLPPNWALQPGVLSQWMKQQDWGSEASANDPDAASKRNASVPSIGR